MFGLLRLDFLGGFTRPAVGSLALGALLLFAGTATAAMPPHVTRTIPAHGGTLIGDTVVIEGYSLGSVDPKKRLRIVASTGVRVPVETELKCVSEGDCGPESPPGACQEKCRLDVRMIGVPPGARLTLVFLDVKLTFEVGGEKEAPKAPKEKKE